MSIAIAMQPETPPDSDSQLNAKIVAFGREIFRAIGREQPSSFNKNYWSGRIMEWSMQRPDFKVNMFRLVDVLPTLPNSQAVAEHITQYLGGVGADLGPLFNWGLNVAPNSLRAKLTAYVTRRAVKQMASQFIAGESPEQALKPLKRLRASRLAFTADLLGEFSVSEPEALHYLERYLEALEVFGRAAPEWDEKSPIVPGHRGEFTPVCISVKLSALYSQTNVMNFDRSVAVLSERLATIVRKAREVDASIYVDAEDSASNQMIYRAFYRVFGSKEFNSFPYPGIVLQAYSKDSPRILDELLEFAKKRGAPIAIRLVKGAYWDLETILSNQNDWPSPLFAHKESSDANYEHLSRIMLENHRHILPAFASHNIRSLSHACCYAESLGLTNKDFELQMLYGMADPIAHSFSKKDYLVRLYVPLGEMLPGMGYLVRRLLENTSNESFLRHTFFDANNLDDLLTQPHFKE